MIEVIRNANLEPIGFREITDSREVLLDKEGQEVGVYDKATKVTRDRHGRTVGLYINQLLRLL
jgi:hypothetical protein